MAVSSILHLPLWSIAKIKTAPSWDAVLIKKFDKLSVEIYFAMLFTLRASLLLRLAALFL